MKPALTEKQESYVKILYRTKQKIIFGELTKKAAMAEAEQLTANLNLTHADFVTVGEYIGGSNG